MYKLMILVSCLAAFVVACGDEDNKEQTPPVACVDQSDCASGQACKNPGEPSSACVDLAEEPDPDPNSNANPNSNPNPDPERECEEDAACAEDAFCDLETFSCKEGCRSDQGCVEGETCNLVSHICEPDHECEEDSECSGDRQICAQHACVQVECTQDEHCGEDEACESSSHTCVAVSACGSEGCPEGMLCDEENGTCKECLSHDHCGPEEVCHPERGVCEEVQVCAPDAREDNNSPEEATTISEEPLEDLTLCAGDVDYFRIEAFRGEQIFAALSPQDGELSFSILAPDETTVLAQGNHENTEIQTPVLSSSGEHFVVVRGANEDEEGTYGLALRKEGEAILPCDDDFYEENDVRGDAEFLPPGIIPGLMLCPEDEDWYAVPLSEGDNVRIELDFAHDEGDLDLYLYLREDMEPLATSTTETDGESADFADVPTTGVYLIRIVGKTPATANEYSISLARF